MLKKTIRYEDFNGAQQERVCYFHMSQSELLELESSKPSGFQRYMQKAVDEENGRELMAAFKELILLSYGKRTMDGAGFTKSQELREEFASSQAYDALFMSLVTDADAATEFINGIIPASLAKEVEKLSKSTGADEEAARVRDLGKNEGEKNVFDADASRLLTIQEVEEMDSEELKAGLKAGLYRLP